MSTERISMGTDRIERRERTPLASPPASTPLWSLTLPYWASASGAASPRGARRGVASELRVLGERLLRALRGRHA
jgi:hypothetical protein